MSASEELTVASLRFDDAAPIGTVFDLTEPDQWVEQKDLADWFPAITCPKA